MSEAFESIRRGMNEAIRHAAGEPVAAAVHRREPIDVKAIRERVGLSEGEFAASVGVQPSTIRDWEQGIRAPRGPARVLLDIISKNPDVVLQAHLARS
jgi:putative transcriptional regulator